MPASMLPELYHAHHTQEAEDIPFWLAWAGKQGGPILELGCGSGRVLLPIAQAGYRVFGLDHDSQMLSFLLSRTPENLRPAVTLIRADFRHYCLTTRFPLITMPCNTYSTIDPRDRRQVLNRARLHLSSRGAFIASMPNPSILAQLPSDGGSEYETSFLHPKSGNAVQVSSRWQRNEGSLTFDWYYDHLLPDGRVERTTISVEHFIQNVDDILGEFSKAGFEQIKIFGDYEQSDFERDKPYLILVAIP